MKYRFFTGCVRWGFQFGHSFGDMAARTISGIGDDPLLRAASRYTPGSLKSLAARGTHDHRFARPWYSLPQTVVSEDETPWNQLTALLVSLPIVCKYKSGFCVQLFEACFHHWGA